MRNIKLTLEYDGARNRATRNQTAPGGEGLAT